MSGNVRSDSLPGTTDPDAFPTPRVCPPAWVGLRDWTMGISASAGGRSTGMPVASATPLAEPRVYPRGTRGVGLDGICERTWMDLRLSP